MRSGQLTANHLYDLAWGGGRTTITSRRSVDEPDKSIGADETFSRDTDDPDLIRRELLRLSAKVTGRMRAAGVVGRTVTLRVRFADFTTITRARTLADPTDVSVEVYAAGCDLFARLGLQRARIRLVGVRVEGLTAATASYRQLALGARAHGWPDAERAADRACHRVRAARGRAGHPAGEPGDLRGPRAAGRASRRHVAGPLTAGSVSRRWLSRRAHRRRRARRCGPTCR